MNTPQKTKTAQASQKRKVPHIGQTIDEPMDWDARITTPAKPADATNAGQICDQCSRTLEEGALYEDHSSGIWDEKSKTFITASGTAKQGRRPMFEAHNKPADAHPAAAGAGAHTPEPHWTDTVFTPANLKRQLDETAAERDKLSAIASELRHDKEQLIEQRDQAREQVKTLLTACQKLLFNAKHGNGLQAHLDARSEAEAAIASVENQ